MPRCRGRQVLGQQGCALAHDPWVHVWEGSDEAMRRGLVARRHGGAGAAPSQLSAASPSPSAYGRASGASPARGRHTAATMARNWSISNGLGRTAAKPRAR